MKLKFRITRLFFSISTIFVLGSFSLYKPPLIKTVVIDAGHGGKDPGCHGLIYSEKNIALGVALKLGNLIESNFKDVKVVYTRKTDVFPQLHERALIANQAKADLFISIHCNSACYRDKKTKKDICNTEAQGVETYVMGLSNEKGNLNVAKRENATILMEDNYEKNYEGFDPNSDEANIIFALYQNVYLQHSLSLASKIQKQYKEKAGRNDRGVKRASLLVLWKAAMPSLLTEIGFLTNPDEEKFLGSAQGQEYIASSIFRAFRDYKNEIEGTNVKYTDDIENKPPPLQTNDTTNNNTKLISAYADSVKLIKDTVKPKPVIDPLKIVKKDTLKKEEIKKVLPKKDRTDSLKITKADTSKVKPLVKEKIAAKGISFKVQIVSSEKKLPANSEKFKGEKVWEYEAGTIFKYTVGDFPEQGPAVKLQSDMRTKGFTDAFVVAFKDGKRIPINDALKLLKD